ncbi:MAG TPA: hypothetical protein VF696_02145 [Candidatus Paceibacterota bacterium]
MAISPGIPTSFVPRQHTESPKRQSSTGTNLFLIVALFLGGVAVLATIGTYAYDKYLTHVLEAKAEELALAQREVDQDQVEEFVRLRDRLVHGRALLDNHVALSQAFDVIETETLRTVKFRSLKLEVAEDHTAQLDIEGTARSFNALAAQSNAFAAQKGIRRAIFSGIVVNQDNTVSFRLSADLDPRLVVAEGAAPAADALTVPQPPQAVPPAPTATTTPAATSTRIIVPVGTTTPSL